MKKTLPFGIVLALVLLTLSLPLSLTKSSYPVSIEIEKLTNNTEDDFGPSLCVDSEGNPHIAWFRNHAGTFEILYGVKQNSHWDISKVVDEIDSWKSPPALSLALDRSGKPRIAYITETAMWSLSYIWWDEATTSWVIEPIANGGTESHRQGVSMVIDSTGAPHIAWPARWGGGMWGVFYATRKEGLWTIETVSHYDDSGGGIALDPNDVPHILYTHDARWDPVGGLKVRYASRMESGWTSEDIYDGPAGVGQRNLFIDPSGVPHVVFFICETEDNCELWYGNKSGGSWAFVQMGEFSYPAPMSIFLNSKRVPYVTWPSYVAGARHIFLAAMEGGNWLVTQVTENEIDEHGPSLFIDVADNVHLAWFSPIQGAGEAEIYYTKLVVSHPILSATVDIDPDSLNFRSRGKWITAYVELPGDYDVNDINVSSILLNDTIPVDLTAPTAIGDYDSDSIPDLMVKFDRAQVIYYLLDNIDIEERFTTVTLTITGYLYDGTPFQGSDTIKVIIPYSLT